MKTRKIAVLVLVLALLLCGCGGGDTRLTGRRIGQSQLYSEQEIDKAMDVVESHFRKHFDGCTLHTIVYNEEETCKEAAEWAEQYGAERAIVLKSDFYVDDAGDGSLNPNQTYKNWKWILIRTAFGWELKTWGYG